MYYRINVITIEVPPLRDRGSDILLLAEHFARKFAGELGRAVPLFSEKALDALKKYSWPGNVRELENAIQQIIVMNDESIVEVARPAGPMVLLANKHEAIICLRHPVPRFPP